MSFGLHLQPQSVRLPCIYIHKGCTLQRDVQRCPASKKSDKNIAFAIFLFEYFRENIVEILKNKMNGVII